MIAAVGGNPCGGLKQLDFFGQPVELTFQDQKKYTTICGTIVSIFCLILMAAMIAARTTKLSTGSDPFFSMTEISKEDLTIDIWELGFMFAIQKIDPAVGSLVVAFETMGKEIEFNSQEINLVDCSELLPGGKHETELNNEKFDIERIYNAIKGADFLCPIGLEGLKLEGVFDSTRFSYVKIAYLGCQLDDPEVNCLSDEDIAFETVNFITINSQPNILGEDEEDMIEFVQEMKHFYFIDPSHSQISNLFYLEGIMQVKQYWWDFLEAFEYELLLFEFSYTQPLSRYISPKLPVAERSYVEFYVRADQKLRQYKREEYDVLSYFGDIGGLLDIVLLFGFGITSAFVNRQFQAALVNRAYRLQQYNEDCTPYYQTTVPGHVTSQESSDGDDEPFGKDVAGAIRENKEKEGSVLDLKKAKSLNTPSPRRRTQNALGKNTIDGVDIGQRCSSQEPRLKKSNTLPVDAMASIRLEFKSDKEIATKFKRDLNRQRKKLIDRSPTRQQLYYIYHLILNQRRIVYGQCSTLLYYFRCINCRKQRSLKKQKAYHNDYHLNKGIDKLKEDLDVTNLLEMMTGYRIMKQVLFDKDDQVLMRLQSRNTINSQDEDSNEEMGSSVENHDKLNEMSKTFKHLSAVIGSDSFGDEQTKEEIKQLLRRYERDLDDTQFRLLQGVLSNDFGLLEHIQNQDNIRKTEVMQLRANTLKTEVENQVLSQAMKVLESVGNKNHGRRSSISARLQQNRASATGLQLLKSMTQFNKGAALNPIYNSLGDLKLNVRPLSPPKTEAQLREETPDKVSSETPDKVSSETSRESELQNEQDESYFYARKGLAEPSPVKQEEVLLEHAIEVEEILLEQAIEPMASSGERVGTDTGLMDVETARSGALLKGSLLQPARQKIMQNYGIQALSKKL